MSETNKKPSEIIREIQRVNLCNLDKAILIYFDECYAEQHERAVKQAESGECEHEWSDWGVGDSIKEFCSKCSSCRIKPIQRCEVEELASLIGQYALVSSYSFGDKKTHTLVARNLLDAGYSKRPAKHERKELVELDKSKVTDFMVDRSMGVWSEIANCYHGGSLPMSIEAEAFCQRFGVPKKLSVEEMREICLKEIANKHCSPQYDVFLLELVINVLHQRIYGSKEG